MFSKPDKRKVVDTSFANEEVREKKTFLRSKLLLRTPPKAGEIKEMDLVLQILKEMRMEMTKGFKFCSDQYESLRQEVVNVNKELQLIEKQRKKQAKWQKETWN